MQAYVVDLLLLQSTIVMHCAVIIIMPTCYTYVIYTFDAGQNVNVPAKTRHISTNYTCS